MIIEEVRFGKGEANSMECMFETLLVVELRGKPGVMIEELVELFVGS